MLGNEVELLISGENALNSESYFYFHSFINSNSYLEMKTNHAYNDGKEEKNSTKYIYLVIKTFIYCKNDMGLLKQIGTTSEETRFNSTIFFFILETDFKNCRSKCAAPSSIHFICPMLINVPRMFIRKNVNEQRHSQHTSIFVFSSHQTCGMSIKSCLSF